MAEEKEEEGAEEGGSEWLGQAFALLLVCGLLGLVIWFARGYEPDSSVGFAGDAAAESTDAATEGDDDAGERAEGPDTGRPQLARLHTALFGAVVTESEGLPLAAERGCVLRVSLSPAATVAKVRLDCDDYHYESPVFEAAIGRVTEAVSDDGPIYGVQITTPQSEERRRISIDTSRRTLRLLDGEGTASLSVDEWSAPRAGMAPIDDDAPEASPAAPESCDLAEHYTGGVILADEELTPLTLTNTDATRLELFDARAEPIEGFACAGGMVVMADDETRYRGTVGPAARSIVGSVTFAGEPGLFWLVAVDEATE